MGSGGTLPKQPLSGKYVSEDETSTDSGSQQQIQQEVAEVNSEPQDKVRSRLMEVSTDTLVGYYFNQCCTTGTL